MILKSIKLNNIRSYTLQEIEFPVGSVLLSGDIGSGKSSILQAIEFALFGASRSNLPGTALLRHGAKNGFVELKLELDGKEVIIKRTLKRSRTEVKQDAGYVVVNGVKTEGTPIELKSRILELISYPPELLTKSKDLIYRYTVYTPQEEMKQILTENKDERLNTLRKVFGIDKYKLIRENTGLFVRHIKEQRMQYKGEILDLEEKNNIMIAREEELKRLKCDLEKLTPNIEEIKSKVKEKKEYLKQLESKLVALNNLRKQLEVNDARLKEKIELATKSKADIGFLEQSIAELTKNIGKIKVEEIKVNEKELEKEISTKEKEYHSVLELQSELRAKLASVNSKIEHINEWININSKKIRLLGDKEILLDELSKEIIQKPELKQRISETDSLLQETNENINSYETNKKASEEIKNKLSEISNCPTCFQPVAKEHKHQVIKIESDKIKAFLKRIDEHNVNKSRQVKELEQLKKYFDILLEKEKQYETLKFEVTALKELNKEYHDKTKLNEGLNLKKKEIESSLLAKDVVAKSSTELENRKSILARVRENNLKLKERAHITHLLDEKTNFKNNLKKEHDRLKEDIGLINSRKLELNSEIKKFSNLDKEFEAEKEKLDTLLTGQHKLDLKATGLRKEFEGVDKVIADLDKEIKRKLESKQKLNHLNELENWFDNYFVKLMHAMEKQVMLKVYHEFNEVFTTWFNVLVEDETMNIRLDEEFTPVVEQNGYETSVEHLSGGERTACSLAYRLALNKVINDVMSRIKTRDIIILDEPTDGFSSEQLDKVRDVLEQLGTKQTIIVSHESKIESFVDNVIKVNKHEHVSSVG